MSNLEFRKIVPLGRGGIEVSGWQAVHHLTTPELIDWRRGQSADCVIFEDVFATGRCQYLLGDCLTMADHGLISADRASELINGVIQDLARSLAHTGAIAALEQCVQLFTPTGDVLAAGSTRGTRPRLLSR